MGEPNEKLTRSRPNAQAGSRSLVLAIRVGLLLFAAGGAAAAVFVGQSRERHEGRSGAQYVCPMHSEVTSPTRGECPICRMELEPINGGGAGAAPGAISSSTYQSYEIPRRRGTGPDAPSPAWVETDGKIAAVVYKDELEGLAPEARALFYRSDAPREGIEAHLLGEPAEPWDRSTLRVHFRVDAATSPPREGELGQLGWVRLTNKGHEMAVIPYHAILEGADGPYVLVASADRRTLARRPLEIGKVYADLAFVLSGLRPQERVLVRSAFFVDAERRLRREPAIEVTP